MFADRQAVLNCIAGGFGGRKALVVGDLMLDRHVWGDVHRISPEAPVPVLKFSKQTESGGGAASVASNLAGLKLMPSIIGLVGADAEGALLLEIMKKFGIRVDGVVSTDGRPTITKTRLIGGHQQMLRIDREEASAMPGSCEERLTAALEGAFAERPDVVIISDYAKGVLTEGLCQKTIAWARARGLPVLVDPKGADYTKYRGATCITPNKLELSVATGVGAHTIDDLIEAGRRLRDRLHLDFLVLTRGEQGMTLIEKDHVVHIPAVAQDVFDVTGAGDTVIATLAAALSAGLGIEDSLHLANTAAGIVVSKTGAVPIHSEELLDAVDLEQILEHRSKISDLDILLKRIRTWKERGERVVFTNGCFDLLHAGHVTLLERAKREGDRLIVGLNTDDSVRRLKGEERPIVRQEDRALVLSALESIDAVILFGEDTPLELIKAVQPDVLVKGGDYSIDEVVGASEVESRGGKVVLIPLVDGRSSTRTIDRIRTLSA